jgi:malate dehydrogenase (oxaloacetate-decarboxylating)
MASSPSPGYSITLRVAVSSSAGSTTDLASAVAETGAAVTALDIVESRKLPDARTVEQPTQP